MRNDFLTLAPLHVLLALLSEIGEVPDGRPGQPFLLRLVTNGSFSWRMDAAN